VPVLPVSAKSGQGFEAVTELLDQDGNFGRKILNIDYDVYAEGEAELGWLNCSTHVAAPQPFALDTVLLDIVGRLQQALQGADAEVAHLKAIGLWEGYFGVANLVSTQSKPELSLPSNCEVKEADVIVNARVAIDPAILQTHVHDVLQAACKACNAKVTIHTTQSFRPGRPQPTHRYEVAV
jgi:hypothetical protein